MKTKTTNPDLRLGFNDWVKYIAQQTNNNLSGMNWDQELINKVKKAKQWKNY